MDAIEAMMTRRTIRRYKPREVPREALLKCVDCARLAPSAANLQPLEYVVVDDPELTLELYGHVKMGSYFQGDDVIGDDPAERPFAYIAVLIRDTGVRWSQRDIGASVQNILLAAHCMGLGTCWMANIQRDPIRRLLEIPEGPALDCMIAVGVAGEESRPVEYRDSNLYFYERPGLLNVPKRRLGDIAWYNRYGGEPL
jgi:nitroreductase